MSMGQGDGTMTMTAPSFAGTDDDLASLYQALPAAGYDEMIDAAGAIRPHWRRWLDGIERIPRTELASRSERLDRRVRDTGIAYDIFADPNKPSQRWQLDLAHR